MTFIVTLPVARKRFATIGHPFSLIYRRKEPFGHSRTTTRNRAFCYLYVNNVLICAALGLAQVRAAIFVWQVNCGNGSRRRPGCWGWCGGSMETQFGSLDSDAHEIIRLRRFSLGPTVVRVSGLDAQGIRGCF